MKPLICISLLAFAFVCACKPSPREPVKDNNDNGEVVLKDTLSPDAAKRLVKNFSGRVFQRKQGALLMSDTRCVWFSSKQLEALLARVRNEGGNGVRFYMATYDKEALNDVKCREKYRDYSTLVMVSTRDSISPKGDTLHFDYFNKSGKLKGAILTATPENQGELCPPPSNCTPEGALLLQ